MAEVLRNNCVPRCAQSCNLGEYKATLARISIYVELQKSLDFIRSAKKDYISSDNRMSFY